MKIRTLQDLKSGDEILPAGTLLETKIVNDYGVRAVAPDGYIHILLPRDYEGVDLPVRFISKPGGGVFDSVEDRFWIGPVAKALSEMMASTLNEFIGRRIPEYEEIMELLVKRGKVQA